MRKAQINIILVVLLIIIFGGLALFLLSFARTISQDEYMHMYAHNLLLSILRTDTGYTDIQCKLVSDVTRCGFFQTEYRCGKSGPNCLTIANESINEYISRFRDIRKNFRYLFTVEPVGFVARSSTGEPLKISIGDSTLKTAKISKWAASEEIRKITATGEYRLRAQLIIALK